MFVGKNDPSKDWGVQGFVLGCRARSGNAGKPLLPNHEAAGIGKSRQLGPCLRGAAAVGPFGKRQLKPVANAGRDWKEPRRRMGILVTQANCNDPLAPLLFIAPLDAMPCARLKNGQRNC